MDVFESASSLAQMSPGIEIACFFSGDLPDEVSRFFMNVTSNRGVEMRFFRSKKEPLEWLGVVSEEGD